MIMISDLISKIACQHKKFKVLIAESDDISELVLSYFLTNISFQIIYTQNRVATITICTENPDIDLILMEVWIWDYNRLETVQKIKQLNENAIFIALVKSSFIIDNEKKLLDIFDGYLSKPVKRRELYMLIIKTLARNQKIWTDNSHNEVL